jgi:hypothetical protein
MTCNNCLQEIVEGELFLEDEDEGTAYHVDCRQAAIDRRNKAEDERAALKTRAEAAEKLAAELKFERNAAARRAYNTEVDNQQLTAENRRLAARVAELEAQMAAQGWRPVTDYPANDQEVDLIVPATYYQAEYDPFTAEMMLAGYYLSDDGDMLRTLPTHWRPRPSPSIAAEATE